MGRRDQMLQEGKQCSSLLVVCAQGDQWNGGRETKRSGRGAGAE